MSSPIVFPLHYSFYSWISAFLQFLLLFFVYMSTQSYIMLSIIQVLAVASSLAVYSFLTPRIPIVEIPRVYALASTLLMLSVAAIAVAISYESVAPVIALILLISPTEAVISVLFEAILPLTFTRDSLLRVNFYS